MVGYSSFCQQLLENADRLRQVLLAIVCVEGKSDTIESLGHDYVAFD
jgi:hypothetical protein